MGSPQRDAAHHTYADYAKAKLAKIRLSLLLLAAASVLNVQAAHTDEEIVVLGRAVFESLTVPPLEEAREILHRIPGGANVIAGESYRRGRVSTLQDALGYSAGVFVQPRFGADEARLSIRGSGVQRTFHLRGIQLLQDGVPLNQADGSGDFQSVDALTAQYIEVYRGANALQFGTTTLGGAINFISPTGVSAPAASLRAELGSFDYKRLQGAGAGKRGIVDYYLSTTYGAQDGFRAHARQENTRLSGNLGLRLANDLETRFYVFVADSDSELPGTLTSAQLGSDPAQANRGNVLGDNKRDFLHWRASNKTVYQMGASRLEFAAFYSYKDLFHPIFQVLDIVTDDYGLNLRFVSEAALFGHKNFFTAGFTPHWGAANDDRFANVSGRRGTRRAQFEQRAANYALYAENQHYIGHRLALVTGLQLTRSERELDDLIVQDGDASFEIDYEAISPKLGIRYELNDDTQIYGNISRGFEPPSFGELSGAQLINVLTEQSATSFEVGSRGQSPSWKTGWDVSYYYAEIADEFLSLTDSFGQPLGTISADDTIHQGIELALLHQMWERIEIRQTYLWSALHFDDDRVFGDNQLAGLPEHLYRAEIRYLWPAGYYLGPTVEWVPVDTPADHANTLFADGYAIIGIRAGYRRARGLAWFVDARNLTDENYAATTGVIADAGGRDSAQFLPGDGVAVYAGIEWRY